MSTATTERQFAAANLDPALAEAVDAASPGDIIEGIVRLEDPRQVPPDFRVVSRFHRICTGRFAADRAWAIRRHPNVISLKATRSLGVQDDEVAADASLTVRTQLVDGGGAAAVHRPRLHRGGAGFRSRLRAPELPAAATARRA